MRVLFQDLTEKLIITLRTIRLQYSVRRSVLVDKSLFYWYDRKACRDDDTWNIFSHVSCTFTLVIFSFGFFRKVESRRSSCVFVFDFTIFELVVKTFFESKYHFAWHCIFKSFLFHNRMIFALNQYFVSSWMNRYDHFRSDVDKKIHSYHY